MYCNYIHDCNDVWNSPDGFNWTCVTDSAVFKAGDDTRAIVFDDKIWVIGGTETDNPRNDVWCSSDGINWICVTNSAQWSPRWEHRVVVFDNKIWVLGGWSNGSWMGDVWYSTDGVDWTCTTDSAECMVGRTYFNTAAFNNKLWVTGGYDHHTRSFYADIWYSTDGREWIHVTSSAPWGKRCEHEILVFDNKMWILAGLGTTKDGGFLYYDDAWYSTDGYFWARETSLTKFRKRWDFTSVVFDNKIWVMGGFDSSWVLLNDVWYRTILRNNNPLK